MILGGIYFKANGKMWTGRTYGTGTPGLMTPDILFSGMVGQIKMGETVVAGDLVYPNSAAQEFMLADPTQAAIKGPVQAIMLEGGANGKYSLALFEGYMKYTSWLTTEYMASKARMLFTTTGIGVDEDTVTVNGTIFGWDISADGVAGADVLLLPASSSQANCETAMTLAIVNAALIAIGDTEVRVETDWAGNDLSFAAIQAGIAGNAIVIAESNTNMEWTGGAVLLAGGTDAGIVYCGDVGKPACLAGRPATTNDMNQIIGVSLSPSELMFKPITDYDLSA
jgi:hypothetical protein